MTVYESKNVKNRLAKTGLAAKHSNLFEMIVDKIYAENDYFKQHLECEAPKRWSKYTTDSL